MQYIVMKREYINFSSCIGLWMVLFYGLFYKCVCRIVTIAVLLSITVLSLLASDDVTDISEIGHT